MGIHGLLPHLGPGVRISLAKLSAHHFTTHNRPFRLAIDISIWLFQIQSGKGGSNPALRTFYYRLLRLLSLNIHPLFVFDGPNKPLFKRNKKVGGPGVKVATVPEFLAKQLLKQFGFPWHVAPGEAEAECALLQRQSVVDAVLSEDVDTLMFGSGVTLRNWSGEGASKGNKAPTHVSVYRAHETKERSRGIDKEGMILVALMSGGDYIPEGVPGVGVKVACDAARAGFGKELCALHRKDGVGLKAWKERLENEIRANASKFFSRKNTGFVMPEDFPSREVLGHYTHPCVSTPEKVERLRKEVKWDLGIDFGALRTFAADAFDWRCKGGAKKFIKNLAPALLIRELRMRSEASRAAQSDSDAQEAEERSFVHAIHGKRNHVSADGELEYRISFTPVNLVPIDLSLEEEDDEFTPAGGIDDDSDAESELLPSTQAGLDDNESDAPVSPSKKRQFRPYYPDQPEKLWILRPFLHAGCPLIVEDYEASISDPKEFLKQRRMARAANKKDTNIHAPKQAKKKKTVERGPVPENALMAYARTTKAGSSSARTDSDINVDGSKRTMKELSPRANSRSNGSRAKTKATTGTVDEEHTTVAAFKLPSTQIPMSLLREKPPTTNENREVEALDLSMSSPVAKASRFSAGIDPLRPFAAFAIARPSSSATQRPLSSQAAGRSIDAEKTPKRKSKKRPPPELSSPALSQKTITSYYSPSPRTRDGALCSLRQTSDIVNLISSSPARLPDPDEDIEGPLTPTPQAKARMSRPSASPTPRQRPSTEDTGTRLPDTVTKRRRKGPLQRSQTEPVGSGLDADEGLITSITRDSDDLAPAKGHRADTSILISSSPARSDGDLASPSTFNPRASQRRGQDDMASQETASATARSRPPNRATRMSNAIEFAGEGGFVRGDTEIGPVNGLDQPLPLTFHEPQAWKPPSFQMPNSQASRVKVSPQEGVKTRIILRESLEGAWKEVQVDENAAAEAQMLDMTGDGSGWKKSGKRAEIWTGWRKSGVEVLDLTGV